MDFDTLEYLQNGSIRQRQAYTTLTQHQILTKLERFDPILVGTIPLNIDIEGSDLDIICCFDKQAAFADILTTCFQNERDFAIREGQALGAPTVVANFWVEDFQIEVFGQPLPTRQQLGYRHMIVEHRLLMQQGEEFRQQIVALKRQGYKTEPAFAQALGLTGDPYVELLRFEMG